MKIDINEIYIITTVTEINGHYVDDDEEAKGKVMVGEKEAIQTFENMTENKPEYYYAAIFLSKVDIYDGLLVPDNVVRQWMSEDYKRYLNDEYYESFGCAWDV